MYSYTETEEVVNMRNIRSSNKPLQDTSRQSGGYPSREKNLNDYTSEIKYPGTCTAVIGTMTNAMRAQTALENASIRASVTKISSNETHNGCAYGIVFSCLQMSNVRVVLENSHIKVRRYLD